MPSGGRGDAEGFADLPRLPFRLLAQGCEPGGEGRAEHGFGQRGQLGRNPGRAVALAFGREVAGAAEPAVALAALGAGRKQAGGERLIGRSAPALAAYAGGMKLPRRALLCLACSLGLPLWAAEPRVNLWVELRWVDSRISQAAVAGVRDGAVVVGTGGSVLPRGAVVLGTEQQASQGQVLQRLTVLNGYRASVQLGELVPLQWLDLSVPLPGGSGATPSARDGGRAQLRQGHVEQLRGFSLEPHWPGGREPVRVSLRAQDLAPDATTPGQPAARAEVESTALVPLDQWVTVARTGGQLRRSERGTLSSRDAEAVSSRELQVRIQVAP